MSMQRPLVGDDQSQEQLSKSISGKSSVAREGRQLKGKLSASNEQGARMMNLIRSGLRFAAGGGTSRRGPSLVLLLLALASSINLHVRCQDFEDLKNNNLQRQAPTFGAPGFPGQAFGNQPAQQQVFANQPSRQQQFPAAAMAAASSASSGLHNDQSAPSVNSRSPFQRPVLSSRFSQQQQQQQPASQPASPASMSTSSVLSGAQQTAVTQASSNNESIVKNSLARTVKLESAESRQAELQAELNSQPRSSSAGAQTGPTSAATGQQRERQAEASESAASTQPAEEPADRQTTTQSSHETVYSDQRFANLFARRNAAKKSKLVPMEQPKAKPTLPSFIKSLPDPKQFTANPVEQAERPISSSSSNLISARLQQQQQQQPPQGNQNRTPKKGATVTNLPALANNKRGQVQKPAGSAPKASAAAAAAKPGAPASGAAKPSLTANNPFSKSQANSSDPANVIAMARRRLLANSAAQQKQQAN